MYAEYFGLKQAPFSIAPDPHYLFMSERHREALAHLLYGIRGGGGFVLLSGEIGTGKTTICRCFLEQIPKHCRVAYIFNPKLTVSDLLKTICHEFQLQVEHTGIGPATIKDHLDPLNEYLLASHAKGLQNILIVDEAQGLTPHVLEQLRLLTNLETAERKLLQVILIGQPELRKMVARPEMEQLAQRVIARFHLGVLSEVDTRQYIQHRMGIGGLRGPIPFSAAALQRIHTITRGVPRRINLLCDRSLLGAYANGLPLVDQAVVNKAAAEVFETDEKATAAAPVRAQRWTAGAKTLLVGALGGGIVASALFWLWTGSPAPWANVSEPTSKSDAEPSPTVNPSTIQPEPSPAASASIHSDASPTDSAPAARVESPPPSHSLPTASALLTSELAGLRELGVLWSKPLEGANPCASALRLDLQCFRTNRMTLHGLGQMDRPAVLILHLPGHDDRWALITAITQDSVTLRAGLETWMIPLSVLADIWQGDYTTLWQLPPGHQGELRQGDDGPEGAWLRQQLDKLAVNQPMPASANNLKSRIEAFQLSQGLEADGLAGPMTFMQINRVSGVKEPRLRSPSI